MKLKDTKPIDRRTAVSRLGGLAALSMGIGMVPMRIAKSEAAERQVSEHFLLELGEVVNLAEILFIDVAVSEVPNITKAESEIRNRLEKPLKEAEKYDLILLWRHDQISLGKAMQERHISTTKYQPGEARPPDKIKVETTESCWEVILSIILQTFGIDYKLKGKFWEVIENRNLKNLVKDIMSAAKVKNWPKTTMLLRKFFTLLTSSQTLKLLEQTIGKEAFEKILKTFGSRFVPWLGWGLMALSFVTSLSTNWDRLQKCNF